MFPSFLTRWPRRPVLASTAFLGAAIITGALHGDICYQTTLIPCPLPNEFCNECEPCGQRKRTVQIPSCVRSARGYRKCAEWRNFDCRETLDCEPNVEDFNTCGSINDVIQRTCHVPAGARGPFVQWPVQPVDPLSAQCLDPNF